MTSSAELHDSKFRRRARRAKRRAGERCSWCRRHRRMHWWEVWRPAELDAHHVWRGTSSPLLVLCAACHDLMTKFDRRSPLPTPADTALLHVAAFGIRVALLCSLIVVAAVALMALHIVPPLVPR